MCRCDALTREEDNICFTARYISFVVVGLAIITRHSLLLSAILGSPLPSTTSDPVNQPQPSPPTTTASLETIYRTSKSPRSGFRVAKAIGLYPQTNTAVVLDRQPITTTTTTTAVPAERGSTSVEASVHETVELSFRENLSSAGDDEPLVNTTSHPQRGVTENVERIRSPTTKKDSKITWIVTTGKSGGRPKYDQQEGRNQSSSTGVAGRNVSFDEEEVEELTVLPLQEDMSRADLTLNRTRSSFVTSLSAAEAAGNAAIRTFNRSEDEVEIDEEVAQTQHFATAASILEGEVLLGETSIFSRPKTTLFVVNIFLAVSGIYIYERRLKFFVMMTRRVCVSECAVGVSAESTRLSRARNTFITKHFQRDQVQGDNHPSDYDAGKGGENAEQQGSTRSAADIAAITGSCLATVALLSTMGSLGFIMYR